MPHPETPPPRRVFVQIDTDEIEATATFAINGRDFKLVGPLKRVKRQVRELLDEYAPGAEQGNTKRYVIGLPETVEPKQYYGLYRFAWIP